MNFVSSVRSWLETDCCIKVSDEWTTACIEWIVDEKGSSVSLEQLKKLVYEQWLLSDLADLSSQCLPSDVSSKTKCEITGPFALQINKIVDVGLSGYSQLQKIKGSENENAAVSADKPTQPAWEPKPTRMMMMLMTDGTTEVQGMEYRSIPELHPNLPSGTKVLILGKLSCRRSVIMLERENVRILGGEVDSLMEVNTKETMIKELMETNQSNAGSDYTTKLRGGPVTKGCGKSIKMEKTTFSQTNRNNTFPSGTSWNTSSRGNNSMKTEPLTQTSQANNTSMNTQGYKREVKSQTRNNQDEWGDDINYEEMMDDDFDEDFVKPQTKTPSSSNKRKSSSTISRGRAQQSNNSSTNSRSFNENSTLIHSKTGVSAASNVNSYRQDATGRSNSQTQPRLNISVNINYVDKCVQKVGNQPSASGDSVNLQFDDQDFDDDFNIDEVMTADQSNNREDKPPVPSSSRTSLGQTSLVTNRNLSNKSPQLVQTKFTLSNQTSTSMSDSSVRRNLKRPSSSPTFGQEMKRTSGASVSIDFKAKCQRILEQFMLKSERKNCDLLLGLETEKLSKYESTDMDRKPFTYLSTVNDYLSKVDLKRKTFCVKAYVSTINSRLESNKGAKWSVSCKINDGTSSLIVEVSNNVLVQLIGFSAAESMEMRKRVKTEPELKDILLEGVKQCQDKIVSLSCLMELEATSSSTNPTITKLITWSHEHAATLFQHVSNKLEGGLS